jgi:deoxyribodipyrimidine photo-lyase
MHEEITAIWFKKDLRTTHNHCLDYAQHLSAQKGRSLFAFYVIETEYWNSSKSSELQKNFVLQCLRELKSNLQKMGGNLHILQAPCATEAIKTLLSTFHIKEVVSHMETGNLWTFQRDRNVKRVLQQNRIPWIELSQHPITRGKGTPSAPCDTPSTQIKHGGTTWKEAKQKCDLEVDAPQNINHPLIQKGGESQAVELWDSFLKRRCLAHQGYRKSIGVANEAPESCSRLSPHLTWGSISQKTLWEDLATTHKNAEKEKQYTAFAARLHWRNHFLQSFEQNWQMETTCLNPKTENLRGWNESHFQRWAHGQTGYPFVDACMRQLIKTGWLHFRGRALLTSFAAYALNLDWRGFGPHLAQHFLDYEPGIHYWQLQLQSGTTTQGPLRIYNPLKQSLEKDPQGTFIKKWVPELQHLHSSEIHLPLQKQKGYPTPVVPPEYLLRTLRANSPQKPKSLQNPHQLDLFTTNRQSLFQTL